MTGKLIYRVRHAASRGPVHAVLCDNWVVYHYWNIRAARYEMSVLELFDDSTGRSGVSVAGVLAEKILGGDGANATVSSFAPAPLRVLGQSYYFAPGARASLSHSVPRLTRLRRRADHVGEPDDDGHHAATGALKILPTA